MGLGGAAGAAGAAWLLVVFAGLNGIVLAIVGGFVSLDARDRFERRGLTHVRWRRRLSRLLLPLLLIALWVGSVVAYAFAGDRVGFGWTLIPVLAASVAACWAVARLVRRAEFGRAPASPVSESG